MAPPDRQSSCDGKVRLSAAQAAKVVKRGGGQRRSAYHCTYCSGWHIGHSSGRGQLAKRRRT